MIVIEHCSIGGFPFEEVSENRFLSIEVSFWCCGSFYFVVSLLLFAIFLFAAIIIDLLPNKLYHNTFLGSNCGLFVSRLETCYNIFKLQ
jgi:hypothetical protein